MSNPPVAKTQTTVFNFYASEQDLPEDEKRLAAAAREAAKTSHSPYSKFRVGAAVLLKDETIITGSNQENASFGLSNCAERTALHTAGSLGKQSEIKKIAIIGYSALETSSDETASSPLSPCGACRQVIKEFEDLSGSPVTIICCSQNGPIHSFSSINSLLPFAFGPSDFVN